MNEEARKMLEEMHAKTTPGRWSPVRPISLYSGDWRLGQITEHRAHPIGSLEDVEFCCAAHEVVPKLLADVARLEAELSAAILATPPRAYVEKLEATCAALMCALRMADEWNRGEGHRMGIGFPCSLRDVVDAALACDIAKEHKP